MKTIGIFTTTRAEFGLFMPLLREIENSDELDYKLFVGGAHLAAEYGKTIHEIEKTSFQITKTFDYLLNQDGAKSLAESTALESSQLVEIFSKDEFDLTCLLGDRIELLPIVMNSIIFKKPIVHIHGGEKSEGASDEQIRHMVTKAAHLHFVSCEEYGENIRKMGEAARRIHNVGALAVDNILNAEKKPIEEIFTELNLDPSLPTALLTYHPVSLESRISVDKQIENIFGALENEKFQLVITEPGVESGRSAVMGIIKEEISKHKNYHLFTSLGMNKYLRLLPHCEFVIGNSSSGLIEVPYFRIPTINIGDRQKGRIRHQSVIDTDYSVDSIIAAVQTAQSEHFRNKLDSMQLYFGNGHAAEKIVEILSSLQINQEFLRKSLKFPDYANA